MIDGVAICYWVSSQAEIIAVMRQGTAQWELPEFFLLILPTSEESQKLHSNRQKNMKPNTDILKTLVPIAGAVILTTASNAAVLASIPFLCPA